MSKIVDAILMIDSKLLEKELNESNKDMNKIYSKNINSYPIHLAMQTKNKNIIETLVNHNADLNVVDVFGDTPLNMAVKFNLFDITKLLLYKGAEQFYSDKNVLFYPIETAINEKKYDFVKLFLQYSHTKNEIDEQTFIYTTIKESGNLDPEVDILFRKFFKKNQNRKDSNFRIQKKKNRINIAKEDLTRICLDLESEKSKKQLYNWAKSLRIKNYKNKSNNELCLVLGNYYFMKKKML